MQAYVDFVRADPKAYRLMFDGDHHELRDYPELQRASLRAKATMSRHIVGMVEAGLLPAETDAAMLGFVGTQANAGQHLRATAGSQGRRYTAPLSSRQRRSRQAAEALGAHGSGARAP